MKYVLCERFLLKNILTCNLNSSSKLNTEKINNLSDITDNTSMVIIDLKIDDS